MNTKNITNTNMERLVNKLNRTSAEILLSRNGENGQNNLMVRNLVRKIVGEIDLQSIFDRMPQLSPDEIAGRATKDILSPLKKIDPRNKFGGTWNQQMAEIAAQDLGIPTTNLHRVITKNGEVGQKLRQKQGEMAKETEALIRRNLFNNPPEQTKMIIQLETWITSLTQDVRKQLETTNPDLSKEEKVKIIEDVILAFIRVLNFAPKQDIFESKLLKTLIGGRMGKSINIVDLSCLAFINSPETGISVRDTAEANTNRVGHRERLMKIIDFTRILNNSSIVSQLSIVVMDKDGFVFEGQEENINKFMTSLEEIIKSLNFNPQLFKASDFLNLDNFEDEWEKINRVGKLSERLVNQEFEHLNMKDLPSDFKTRSFAREIAKKRFLVQFSTGATIPKLFEPAIVLQNARAHSQATELFRLGSGSEKPLIFTFWIER